MAKLWRRVDSTSVYVCSSPKTAIPNYAGLRALIRRRLNTVESLSVNFATCAGIKGCAVVCMIIPLFCDHNLLLSSAPLLPFFRGVDRQIPGQ